MHRMQLQQNGKTKSWETRTSCCFCLFFFKERKFSKQLVWMEWLVQYCSLGFDQRQEKSQKTQSQTAGGAGVSRRGKLVVRMKEKSGWRRKRREGRCQFGSVGRVWMAFIFRKDAHLAVRSRKPEKSLLHVWLRRTFTAVWFVCYKL